jgi:hypothetical protein
MFRSTLSAALIGSGVAQYGYEYYTPQYGYEYYYGRYAYEYGYEYYYGRYEYYNPYYNTSMLPEPPRCYDTGSCEIDLTALEKFTADYELVLAEVADPYNDPGAVTTGDIPCPPSLGDCPTDHGTVAVHARKLQLKLDNHFVIPDDMNAPDPVMTAFLGSDIHEELHIDGAGGRASYHLASPVVNMCIQIDVPWFQIDNDEMDMSLEQAQQVASMQVEEEGFEVTVDGKDAIMLQNFIVSADKSHPKLITVMPGTGPTNVFAMKFSNYVNSVGSQFDVRACEIETQSATQTTLAGNPKVREFIAGRMAKHQKRLQALLEPKALNTRFNFIPLKQVLDLLVPPAPEHCTNEVLAQTAPMGASIFQTGLLGVASCAMGFAVTFGALRKRAAPSADGYYLGA